MRQYLLFFILITTSVNSQNIIFSDPVFKAKLLESSISNTIAKDINGNNIKIDVNSDNEIEQSEALAVYRLFYDPVFLLDNSGDQYNSFPTSLGLTNLTGIEFFTNLQYFDVSGNTLNSLNILSLSNLIYFKCTSCALTSLTLSQTNTLVKLDISNNFLTNFNFTNFSGLHTLNMSHNPLTSVIFLNNSNLYSVSCINTLISILDFSDTTLFTLDASNNPSLSYLNIKNGVLSSDTYQPNPNFPFNVNTIQMDNSIDYICHDENEFGFILASNLNVMSVPRSTYCSFTPGGSYNTINGNIKFDCGVSNQNLQNVKVKLTNGTDLGYTFSNSNGNYTFYTGIGNHTITPQLINPYFTFSPSNSNINFSTLNNIHNQNFCLSSNGTHPDLKITLIPLNAARPGFDANYKIVVTNTGTEIQNGTVNLTFNDNLIDYITSNPTISNQIINEVSWNFNNLNPYQNISFDITFNLNSPLETPSLNSGDVLTYNAQLTTILADETPNDNLSQLNQTVVNSYDPNDKTCMEGNYVDINDVNKYLHYAIRFQNMGTASAVNVVVTDIISNKLDIETLEIESSSHPYNAKLKNGKLEVIYENINLPDSTTDEPGSHGFISFRIKPKNSVILNDIINNTANIYFDYNFPVITNTTSTQFVTLSSSGFLENEITLFPNPVKDELNFSFEKTISIDRINIYNTLGQLVKQFSGNHNSINLSDLHTGYYHIEFISDGGKLTKKIIKE